ncbi:hypothetical protein OsI_11219 [Oryza sativa Indica Group]|uniref:Uncharacterized protein n=5 Tax=Oryza TaxID=4527 RepID=Q10ML3_ORYSJ|nr:hypothetical protein LOC_Os03g19210 [Oryza sativa Japonica Group]EAY89684.1 hypothetical protein OsI_11219 [Oryza sativa Indica Group]
MERKTLASYALLRSCGCLLAATAMLTAALQHILVVLDAAGMESAALEGKLASYSHGHWPLLQQNTHRAKLQGTPL